MADQNSEETIHLSGTEDRLLSDKSGEYREQLLKELMDEASRLNALVEKGSAPDKFEKNTSMLVAVLAAADTVSHVWNKHHGDASQ